MAAEYVCCSLTSQTKILLRQPIACYEIAKRTYNFVMTCGKSYDKYDPCYKAYIELGWLTYFNTFQHSNKYDDIPRNSDEFPVERVRFLDTIGEGNFGKVMKAEALDINRSGTWEMVAVKMWKGRYCWNQL